MQTPIIPILPDAHQHLTEAEVKQYALARVRGVEPSLSIEKEQHLEECPQCQQAIMETFTVLAHTPLEEIPAVQDLLPAPKKSKLVSLIRPAMRVASMLLMGFSLLTVYWIVGTSTKNVTRKWESPFENKTIDVMPQTWQIQGTEAKTLYLSNGSYVKIPAGAFVNAQGEEARGNITIQYREMRTLSDLLASGVPTKYDSLNVKHTLATLGMFEIRAYQDGKPLKLSSHKALEVNMLTEDASKDFSHYYLQEDNSQLAYHAPLSTPAYASPSEASWQYLSASQMHCDSMPNLSPLALLENKKIEVETLEKDIRKSQEETENASKSAILYHKLPETNKLFSLQLNEKEYPGLSRYHNTVWEYAGENSEHNPANAQDWVLQEKWDHVQLKEQRFRSISLAGHIGSVRSAVFSPDAQYILTASDDYTAKIWNKDGQLINTLDGHHAGLNGALYAPDGQNILTFSEDKTAIVWNNKGDKLFTLQGHTAPIKSASYTPNGQYILTTSADNTARLWTNTGNFLFALKHAIPSFEAQISPDNSKILVINENMFAEIWAITGEKIRTIKGLFGSARFSTSGEFIITTSRNPHLSKAIIWATETGKLLRELTDITDTEAMFTPDEGHIYSYSGATPRLWHWNKHKPNSTVLIRDMRNNPREKREGHTQKIRKSFFSQNGDYIMTAGTDNVARIWSRNGNLIRTLREHTAPINTVQTSQDGKMWVTASDDNTAKIWKEREEQDVMELILVKHHRKLVDDKGQRYEIKGKEYHVPVRIRGEREEQQNGDMGLVVTRKSTESTENIMLERYERVLAEYKALQNTPKMANNQFCFRQFRIQQMGVYACAKAIVDKLNETYTLQLESDIPNKSLHLYRVGQVGKAYLLQKLQKQKEVKLANKEMLVVIFPQDRLAMYQHENLSKDCSLDQKLCKVQLKAQAQVVGKEELDKVMR